VRMSLLSFVGRRFVKSGDLIRRCDNKSNRKRQRPDSDLGPAFQQSPTSCSGEVLVG
jgi:hypothetical protein